ncbi:tetratricopeptide repeat protein, partial [candidate division WOR-3 bacterium]|nr:tetratricopeptide repeat protein [candidate division WOR-3 bacterium]
MLLAEDSLTPARNTIGKLCLAAAAVLLLAGCAYFNTFYNARQYYKEGLRYKEQNQLGQAKGKFDKAIEKSAVVLSRWPRSRWADDALYLIAMSYFHEALYPKALRHLNQFVLAFPESPLVPDAELHRGLALQKDREYGQAWAVLDAVRQRYPRLAGDAAYYLAQPAFDREEYAPAVDSLAAFVARYPRSRFVKPAMLQLAQACFRTGRWADAEGWYGKYERIETDARKRAAARLEMAACRYEKGDFQGAVAEVREIIGRYQEYDDEANLLLGQALSRMERYSEAISAWSNLRGATAQGAEAAFLIGKHHEEAESFERARAYYDTARSRRADSDHGVLAVKRLSLLDAFAQRDSSTTDTAEAEFLLAEVYNLNLGDFDRAAERYQRVYDSFPQSEWAPKALFAKAWIVRNVRHDTAA